MFIPARSGVEFEQAFFGMDAVRTIPFEDIAYKCFDESVNELWVIQASRYKWNSASPSTESSRALFNAVKQALEFVHRNNLRVECSIGTSLDVFHGIDGVFSVNKKHRVFIDLTANVKKTKSKHSDIILIRKQDLEADKFEFLGKVIGERLLESMTPTQIHAPTTPVVTGVYNIERDSRFRFVRGDGGRVISVLWNKTERVTRRDVELLFRQCFKGTKRYNMYITLGEKDTFVFTRQ